jgi:hypothetical protein
MRFSQWMFIFLAVLLIGLQGCHTFSGAAQGFKKDIQGIREKDHPIYKADDWMRENLW